MIADLRATIDSLNSSRFLCEMAKGRSESSLVITRSRCTNQSILHDKASKLLFGSCFYEASQEQLRLLATLPKQRHVLLDAV